MAQVNYNAHTVAAKQDFMFLLATENERGRFYASEAGERSNGLIGYLRGDFGSGGDDFYTNWFDCDLRLKRPPFKKEFDMLVNYLRWLGLLGSLKEMETYCNTHKHTSLTDWLSPAFGFKVSGRENDYFIRATPRHRDYNFYIMCYQRKEESEVLL